MFLSGHKSTHSTETAITVNKLTALFPLDLSPACVTVDCGIVNNILEKCLSGASLGLFILVILY